MEKIENFYKKGTELSPEVILNLELNIFLIKGKSVVTEVDQFYQPIIDWIDELKKVAPIQINFVFDLEYFNVFSSKRILFLFYKLKELQEAQSIVKISWLFSIDDDDMKEVGEDFACMINLPFEFISK